MGFLVEHGRVAFFYCTLKKKNLELPLKMCVLSVLLWERRGVQLCSHMCSHGKARARGAEMRHSMGAEGAVSQGSLLFSRVSWEGDYSPSQNSERVSYLLSFPSHPHDQIHITHLAAHKSLKDVPEIQFLHKGALVSTRHPQLTPCHPLVSS